MTRGWKCFIVQRVQRRTTREDGHTFTHIFKDPKTGKEYVGEDRLPIGAMWINSESNVWGIKIPGQCGLNRFCPSLEYNGHRWTSTGEPPRITVTPSIDDKHHYHGYITDGVITPDLHGRKYDDFGLATV